jgi:hypothetical protein
MSHSTRNGAPAAPPHIQHARVPSSSPRLAASHTHTTCYCCRQLRFLRTLSRSAPRPRSSSSSGWAGSNPSPAPGPSRFAERWTRACGGLRPARLFGTEAGTWRIGAPRRIGGRDRRKPERRGRDRSGTRPRPYRRRGSRLSWGRRGGETWKVAGWSRRTAGR